jgi:DNA-binding XRE family transcriptional regulator
MAQLVGPKSPRAWSPLHEQCGVCDRDDAIGGGTWWVDVTSFANPDEYSPAYNGLSLCNRCSYGPGVSNAAQDAEIFSLAMRLVQYAITPTTMATKVQEFIEDEIPKTVAYTIVVDPLAHGVTVGSNWRDVQARPLHVGIFDAGEPKRSVAYVRIVDPPTTKTSRAFEMFTELREWLNLTTEEAAALIGVGRTTPLAWERAGHEPRPATARRLYQAHSIVQGLVKRLGQDAATEWLERGSPSPRHLLERGEITAVARAAERILVNRQARSTLPDRNAITGEEGGVVVPLAAPRRRRRRRNGRDSA